MADWNGRDGSVNRAAGVDPLDRILHAFRAEREAHEPRNVPPQPDEGQDPAPSASAVEAPPSTLEREPPRDCIPPDMSGAAGIAEAQDEIFRLIMPFAQPFVPFECFAPDLVDQIEALIPGPIRLLIAQPDEEDDGPVGFAIFLGQHIRESIFRAHWAQANINAAAVEVVIR